MKYNSESLLLYCNENNITLNDDFNNNLNNNLNNNNITRESYIKFNCIECSI